MTTRVLVVDDEEPNRRLLARILKDQAEVRVAPSGDDALEQVDREAPDVLVTDLRMPEMDGLELCRRVRERAPEVELVLVSGDADLESALEAVHLGVVEFLQKPVRPETLRSAVERSVEKQRLLETVTRLQTRNSTDEGLGRILGVSKAMERLRRTIARVQHRDTTVLISGETGTGKELVARALHEGGHRQGGPFVAVNCAAVASELLESELFGHEKGAFTGAETTRAGLIEEADGGTFFLDEVGELPMELQAKLLRVLQEREVQRIGGRKPRPVNIRLVAATNRQLGSEVEAGRFRADLYYRLAVFPIRTAPLRERPKDVEELAAHFLERAQERNGLPERPLEPDAVELLARQDWPGNVRELENLIERLVLLADEDPLDASLVREAMDMAGPEPRAPRTEAPSSPDAPRATVEAVLDGEPLVPLKDVEMAYIQKVLDHCDGNKTEAARILGVHPTTLYRKLS